MAVFKLESDKQFIRTSKGDPDVYVFEYFDDPNVFEMIRASNNRWRQLTRVGPTGSAPFKVLEVLGVRIGGNQLKNLATDLTLTARDGQTFHLIVNRQGLCFLYVDSSPVMRLRVNDYFGWSKYGVSPGVGPIWNRWDMSNGAVLVPAAAAPSSDCWKKLAEEKDKLLEKSKETESLLRQSIADKDKQLAALKASMKALVQEV
ncbi:unnamed protein product [Linum tenue]|uniref:Uncharacterized protein n=1 Tax=Linum tenue TaxID=586396 RepID=A0AAV0KRH0_9ROSI|nr:unnamed protein product [Linum tenue]